MAQPLPPAATSPPPAAPAVSATQFADAMQGPHAPTLRLLQSCADNLVNLWMHAFDQPGPAYNGVTVMLFDSLFQELLGELQTVTITLGTGLDPCGQPIDAHHVKDALTELHDAYATPVTGKSLERICGPPTRERFDRFLSDLKTAAESL